MPQSYSRLSAAILALAALSLPKHATARDVNCGCGYRDPVTNALWTDTTILYFNETDPSALGGNVDFLDLDYTNLYEQGFDTIFTQGASPLNVGYNETGALQLTCSAPTRRHLVKGGGIRTTRQDIQYGSFRAGLQPAQQLRQGGSSLTMSYTYNDSQAIEIDLINGDVLDQAAALFRASIPGGSVDPHNTSYADLITGGSDPFAVNEWRFDWTKKIVEYSTPMNVSLSWAIYGHEHDLPSVPGPFILKHWSTGSPSTTHGPPVVDSYAWVSYIRLFYNSTLTSGTNFDQQCQILREPECSTEDNTLRISSEYPAESTRRWNHVEPPYVAPAWALFGVIVSGGILAFLLIHGIGRRLYKHYSIPKKDRPIHPDAYTYKIDRFALHGELTREMVKEKKKSEKDQKKSAAKGDIPIVKTREIDPDAASMMSYATTQENDSSSVRGFSSLAGNKNSKVIASALPTMYYNRPGQGGGQSGHGRSKSKLANEAAINSDDEDDENMHVSRERSYSDASQESDEHTESYANLPTRTSDEIDRDDTASVVAFQAAKIEPLGRKKSVFQQFVPESSKKIWTRFFGARGSKVQAAKPPAVINMAARISHLDGLRGLACFLVSLVHFCLTFYPAFIEPVPEFSNHYHWSKYIRFSINPIFFNGNFGIGVFFILSSRLIGVRYLRAGLLQDLAGSVFRRIPRLAFPVLCAVVLTYFFIGVGATKWLNYLASVTWSTWPYAVEFENVGWFINKFIALLFVQPPQLPSIIYNYCTGVLWTIPVSIMGSWLIFLGVIVVREIKTPWKRFGYYFFCMLNSWYALNWGGYFWVGLAISDLDVTYKWKVSIGQGSRKYALLVTSYVIFFIFMGSQYAQQFTSFSLPTFENAIHPDLLTGLPIGQTERYGYPAFNVPQVYSLFAATALLVIAEFSTVVQNILTIKFLRALGYYSYSIYMLHGLVFWSWGAWLAVSLHTHQVVYWANILVVFISSYVLLGIAIYFWTPIADVGSGYAGNALWRHAQGRAFFATIG